MSPDDRSLAAPAGSDPGQTPETAVGALVARALRRARMLALVEAAAWGAAVAAVSPIAGAMTAVAVAAWRWRRATRATIVGGLERAQPDARNLFVTADELDRNTLAARPVVRARVFADAAVRAQQVDLRVAVPMAAAVRAAAVAAAAWAIVLAPSVWRGPLARVRRPASAAPDTQKPSVLAAGLRITAVVQPPAYTGLKNTTTIDPQQLQAIEGSDLALSIDTGAARVTIDHDGVTRPLVRGADGRFSDRMHLARTGYLVVTGDEGSRRLVPIVVSPDALPAVRVTAPGRDLVYAGGNPRITFNARATDDFGLRSLALHYTKVAGSGEQFEFQEGEIPLAVTAASARDWTGSASASLSELNLKDGDMLVYRAVASDARPGDGSASSDAFFIEISRLGVAAGDAFTLPEEETRYALSQQMLIVKTERLHQQRTTLAPDAFAEAALNLAVEQRMIRAEFVFMLGGEIQDEEVEAEQSTELQEGRLQNRGQRDVRAATIAMSQAQKLLTAASTGDALVAERAAVTALQRAFARDRYILRALATRSQLDPARRLTGSLAGAADWRRVLPELPANRRVARLEDLMSGLAELARDAAAAPASFRQRALVLAEEAVRIDPTSAALREAATQLQRAADAAGDPAGRARATGAAASAATAEARRAHADAATPSPDVAPALSGAFSDALARRP